ncbi:MAG: hypothetical protein ABIR79_12220 [Candidatus Binatia bacterium]
MAGASGVIVGIDRCIEFADGEELRDGGEARAAGAANPDRSNLHGRTGRRGDGVIARPARAVGALTDVGAQKAAAKCQKLIAKTTAKALAGKLKAFNACAAGGATTGFISSAANLLGPGVDANNQTDVFVRDR